jgi:hypothetical protein
VRQNIPPRLPRQSNSKPDNQRQQTQEQCEDRQQERAPTAPIVPLVRRENAVKAIRQRPSRRRRGCAKGTVFLLRLSFGRVPACRGAEFSLVLQVWCGFCGDSRRPDLLAGYHVCVHHVECVRGAYRSWRYSLRVYAACMYVYVLGISKKKRPSHPVSDGTKRMARAHQPRSESTTPGRGPVRQVERAAERSQRER